MLCCTARGHAARGRFASTNGQSAKPFGSPRAAQALGSMSLPTSGHTCTCSSGRAAAATFSGFCDRSRGWWRGGSPVREGAAPCEAAASGARLHGLASSHGGATAWACATTSFAIGSKQRMAPASVERSNAGPSPSLPSSGCVAPRPDRRHDSDSCPGPTQNLAPPQDVGPKKTGLMTRGEASAATHRRGVAGRRARAARMLAAQTVP
jgi:hypothetical protein